MNRVVTITVPMRQVLKITRSLAKEKRRSPAPPLGRTIVVFVLSLLSAFMHGAARPGPAAAEFLKTSEGVYQSLNRRQKIVVSQSYPGVFIYEGKPVNVQTFDPATLDKEASKHVFIKYDPAANRYDAIVIGNQEYRIRGSLTLKLGGLRITVDNSNPYLSIVSDAPEGPQGRPAVLGIHGTDVIANFTGTNAAALLEANQFNQYSGVIEPYALNNANALVLKGEPVRSKLIGLEVEPPRNPCARKGSIYITVADLKRVRAAATREERGKLMERALKKNKGYDLMKNLIILKITADTIISLDYENALVKLIRPHKSGDSDAPICEIEPVEL